MIQSPRRYLKSRGARAFLSVGCENGVAQLVNPNEVDLDQQRLNWGISFDNICIPKPTVFGIGLTVVPFFPLKARWAFCRLSQDCSYCVYPRTGTDQLPEMINAWKDKFQPEYTFQHAFCLRCIEHSFLDSSLPILDWCLELGVDYLIASVV